jgi:hypothetical protein
MALCSLVQGAITLFETMESTKCLPWLVSWMKSVSYGHPVADIMIIGVLICGSAWLIRSIDVLMIDDLLLCLICVDGVALMCRCVDDCGYALKV